MSSITLKEINNEHTLNIFTDASIRAIQNGYIGCYGAIAVIGYTTIDESYVVTGYTTNNNSEIKAIREGILLALKHGAGKTINIFSDSQICILGLRERILRWKLIGNQFIGSMGVISNQEIFMEIAQMILQYNLHINLFHQKGHIIFTAESLKQAQNVFRTSNGFRGVIDMNLIRYISNYNNYVDDETRKRLGRLMSCPCHDPIRFIPTPFDKQRYQTLVDNKYLHQN